MTPIRRRCGLGQRTLRVAVHWTNQTADPVAAATAGGTAYGLIRIAAVRRPRLSRPPLRRIWVVGGPSGVRERREHPRHLVVRHALAKGQPPPLVVDQRVSAGANRKREQTFNALTGGVIDQFLKMAGANALGKRATVTKECVHVSSRWS